MNNLKWLLIFVAVFSQLYCKSEEPGYKLVDGTYTGKSQAKYAYEPYVGKATIVVDNHKIVKVEFQIDDTLQNVVFDAEYEKYFTNNQVYIEQCRNDWKGVQLYAKELLKKQDIDSVDAVSGATWSYNIFKASVKKALNK